MLTQVYILISIYIIYHLTNVKHYETYFYTTMQFRQYNLMSQWTIIYANCMFVKWIYKLISKHCSVKRYRISFAHTVRINEDKVKEWNILPYNFDRCNKWFILARYIHYYRCTRTGNSWYKVGYRDSSQPR